MVKALISKRYAHQKKPQTKIRGFCKLINNQTHCYDLLSAELSFNSF